MPAAGSTRKFNRSAICIGSRRVKFFSRTAFAVFLLIGVAAQLPAAAVVGPCGSGPDWVDSCTPGIYNFPWHATGALNGGPPVALSGSGVVGVGASGGNGHVPIELLSLSLTGPGVVLTLRPGTQSLGSIDQQGPGSPLADSFFDIFFELDISGVGTFHNNAPARLFQTDLTTWPSGTLVL